MAFDFFLLTESSFHASYLISLWIENFHNMPGFKGIIVRENKPSDEARMQRHLFHRRYHSRPETLAVMTTQLKAIYPNLSETEQAMLEIFGVPAYSSVSAPETIFLGDNLNNDTARRWLETQSSHANELFLYIFLDQLLEPWWIELTRSRIINGHSAVLPYARGMFALENMAALGDRKLFSRAAGASVHYVDTGVDTGPIIRAERLKDPFRFDSLWVLKGQIFFMVFDLLIEAASNMLAKPYALPVGSICDAKLYGPNFRCKQFTLEVRRKAAHEYLMMKNTR